MRSVIVSPLLCHIQLDLQIISDTYVRVKVLFAIIDTYILTLKFTLFTQSSAAQMMSPNHPGSHNDTVNTGCP